MVDSFNHWSFGHLRPFVKRVLSFGKGVVIKGHCKFWIFQSFNGVFVVGSLLSFLLAMAYVYVILFPRFQPVINKTYETPHFNSSVSECNYFEGNWIQDESYPLYDASQCPFAENGFNCLANGRRDGGYTKWRWKPKNCEIPRFNAREILEKMRGKRIVFVGDSLSRTQWESLICMLMTGVEDKRSVYEINGNKITKQIRFLGVRFSSFDLRIDFYRSVFLVQPGPAPRRAPKRVKSTLKIDKLDDIRNEWIDSDILIFNSGHWWTPSKLFEIQGLLFSGRRIAEARNAYHCCLRKGTAYMGIMA